MIGLEDRQTWVQHIKTAHTAGARLRPACEVVGISVRTFERWQANGGLAVGDRRPDATRPAVAILEINLLHVVGRKSFSTPC